MVACGYAHQKESAIVINGGYDNFDHGSYFVYTGEGRDTDQKLIRGNQGLVDAFNFALPIRVIRGAKPVGSRYSCTSGYRYDGLYLIKKYFYELDENENRMVFRFIFESIPGESSFDPDESTRDLFYNEYLPSIGLIDDSSKSFSKTSDALDDYSNESVEIESVEEDSDLGDANTCDELIDVNDDLGDALDDYSNESVKEDGDSGEENIGDELLEANDEQPSHKLEVLENEEVVLPPIWLEEVDHDILIHCKYCGLTLKNKRCPSYR